MDSRRCSWHLSVRLNGVKSFDSGVALTIVENDSFTAVDEAWATSQSMHSTPESGMVSDLLSLPLDGHDADQTCTNTF